MTLNDLLKKQALRESDGATLGNVIDALIDVKDGRVVYLLVSQGYFDAPLVLSRKRISLVDGKVMVDVGEDDLDRLRAEAGPETAPEQPLDLTAMPPLVIGPFGNAVAPAMGAAVYNALTGRDRESRPALDKAHAEWHWFETLHGLPVFDSTGELGALDDIFVDPATLTCKTLALRDTGGQLYSFPFSKIRMVSRGETSIVLELSSKPSYSVERIREDLR